MAIFYLQNIYLKRCYIISQVDENRDTKTKEKYKQFSEDAVR